MPVFLMDLCLDIYLMYYNSLVSKMGITLKLFPHCMQYEGIHFYKEFLSTLCPKQSWLWSAKGLKIYYSGNSPLLRSHIL